MYRTEAALSEGDKAPPIIGSNADGRFFSQDTQAGKPTILVALGALEPARARAALDRLHIAGGVLAQSGIELVFLAPFSATYAAAFEQSPARALVIHVNDGAGVDRLQVNDQATLMVLDRNWRIVHLAGFDGETDLLALTAALAVRLASDRPQTFGSSAPVLTIPNVLPPDTCRALIAHFEGSPHRPGAMASVRDDKAVSRLDEKKKRRRDLELTAETPLRDEIVRVLAQRCAPEIKRAFQFDVAYADRILIARYDDSGGYFKRHRDNLTPQTAFREFAISINLNTDEYEGGELLFPEFNDHRHNPPAGGAIVFSASLLHEAAPVTRGSRYVALSFLSSAAAARLA